MESHWPNTLVSPLKIICLGPTTTDNNYNKGLSVKSLCYIAMVKSTLKYASPVWSPYTKQDINKLERVQHQLARGLFIIQQCF